MNHIAIRNEVRKRVVASAAINASSELKVQGVDFDSSGKSFWIEEYLIGGDLRVMSNRRNKVTNYMIQYDLRVPVGSSMDTLETRASAIEESFSGQSFMASGIDCTVRKIKISRREGKNYNTLSILLVLDLNEISG